MNGTQLIVYFILYFKLWENHKQEVNQNFSQIETYNLDWLFTFNVFYNIGSLLGFTSTLLPKEIILSESIYTNIISIFISIFSMHIGSKGMNRIPVGDAIEKLDNRKNNMEEPINTNMPNECLLEKINTFIIEDKAFLKPDLKVWDIVDNTGINRSYISQLINNTYNTSFSIYINQFRIEEACRLINSNKSNSFGSFAFDSGFNSVSTFNRSFKQQKGISPSIYKNRLN